MVVVVKSQDARHAEGLKLFRIRRLLQKLRNVAHYGRNT